MSSGQSMHPTRRDADGRGEQFTGEDQQLVYGVLGHRRSLPAVIRRSQHLARAPAIVRVTASHP